MAYTEAQKRQHIRELQMFLHGLSHVQDLPHVVPDGIYGPKTTAAVREFQRKHQLRPNGETNSATWNTLVQSYLNEVVPPLRSLSLFPVGITSYAIGDSGSAVYLIQGILQALQAVFPELPPVNNNGVFDQNTQYAVRQFQTYTPIEPSGVVDPATWNHLLSALHDNIRFSWQ